MATLGEQWEMFRPANQPAKNVTPVDPSNINDPRNFNAKDPLMLQQVEGAYKNPQTVNPQASNEGNFAEMWNQVKQEQPQQVIQQQEQPAEKSTFEKFTQPLESMSWEDWKQKSLLSPALRYAEGITTGNVKQTEEAKKQLIEKAKAGYSGVEQFLDHPVDSMKTIAKSIYDNPAGSAGEMLKGTLYDPELLLAGPQGGAVAKALVKAPIKATAAVGKGLTETTASILGLTTGVGSDTVKEAFKAGLYKRPEFWENLTGKADKMQVLQDAKDALHTMRESRLGNYADNIGDVFDNKTPLKFDKIDKALNNFLDTITVKTQKGEYSKIGKDQLGKIDEIKDVIKTWKDDPELHTAAGLDALKRRIDAIYPDSPKHSQVQRAVTETRNAVKQTILDSDKKYAEIMKAYEDGINVEKEIERTLSLGPKANPETALKKLQSITRNNVQTSYGHRADLVKQLEQATGKNLTSSLAGQSMATLTPRNLAAQGGGLATLGAAAKLGPEALALLPLQSPAVIGAAAYGTGKALRPIKQMMDLSTTKAGELKDILTTLGRGQ